MTTTTTTSTTMNTSHPRNEAQYKILSMVEWELSTPTVRSHSLCRGIVNCDGVYVMDWISDVPKA